LAEHYSTPKNTIGTELYFSKTYFSTEQLFAWTLTVIILSFIIEKLLIFSIEKIADRSKFTIKDSKKDVKL
jgi:NitT/TauT family transport system permease protein